MNHNSTDSTINKKMYRYVLTLVKDIPIIMSALTLLNTILAYYGIDPSMLSDVGGVSLLTLLFLYLSSIVFEFGICHRLFIHYITIIFILGVIDFYYVIPLDNQGFVILHLVITGLLLFILVFYKAKEMKGVCISKTVPKINLMVSSRKNIYKYELLAIKTIPIITVGIYVLRTMFSFMGIELPIMSFVGGMSLLMIVFMYLTSVVFKFCAYHRIFIHYITIIWILDTIDLYTEAFINMNTRVSIGVLTILTGLTVFIALYLKLKK